MFYKFASPKTGPLPKRRKVRQACDFCRQHRVRCEGTLPCSQCVANRVQCTKPKPFQSKLCSAGSRQPAQRIRSAVITSTSEEPMRTPPPSAPTRSPNNPPPVVPGHIDCLTGFVSRINTFCSAVSQITAHTAPNLSEPFVPTASYSMPDLLREAERTTPRLSLSSVSNLRQLQDRLLDIYWSRYHGLFPVVDPADVLDFGPDPGSKRKALREALISYCLQSLYHAGLHHRLLGVSVGLEETKDGSFGQSPLVSLFAGYFQRALATNGHYLLYAEPAVSDVQRHVLMIMVFLNSGEFLAAYNIIGVAIRLAQSLELQRCPPSNVSAEEAEARRRIWWTLVHFDFHCARYLGRPMIVSLHDIALAVPKVSCLLTRDSSELIFHSAYITLTVVGKEIAESLATNHDYVRVDDPIRRIEVSAEHLKLEVNKLHKWRDHVMHSGNFQNLVLESNARQLREPAAEIGSQRKYNVWLHNQSPARVLQQTLLELQYHDITIWLHRPFIQFPSRGLIPQRSPGADVHATTALQHALTVINVVHTRMLTNDALFGCSDVYQYVWNAALTLIGFMLAYPLCHWFPDARQHVELSFPVFETGKTSNPIASRADHLTRHLLSRVDDLMELVNSSSHLSAGHYVPETSDRGNTDAQSFSPSLLPSQYDALRSGADIMDDQSWFDYCNQIDDMLMDLPDIPFMPDHRAQ